MCVCPQFQLLLGITLRKLYEEPRTTYGELVAEHTFKENNQKLIKMYTKLISSNQNSVDTSTNNLAHYFGNLNKTSGVHQV